MCGKLGVCEHGFEAVINLYLAVLGGLDPEPRILVDFGEPVILDRLCRFLRLLSLSHSDF